MGGVSLPARNVTAEAEQQGDGSFRQIIKVAESALPAGAASEITLAALTAAAEAIKVAAETLAGRTINTGAIAGSVAVSNFPGTQAVSGPLTDAQLRATPVPVSVSAGAGAATETTLAALSAKTPSLGAAAAAASSPVVLAADELVTQAAAVAVINTDLLTGAVSGWYDAANFHSASIQIIGGAGISAGQIFFEQTNDTTAAPNGNPWAVEEDTGLTPTPVVAAFAVAASAVRMFRAPITSRYVRVRVSTAFVGGTIKAVMVASQQPYSRMVQTVHQATAGNLNATIAALPAGSNLAADVGLQARASATGAGTAVALVVPAAPATTTIKATAGRLLSLHLTNISASTRYIKFFNAATGPTMGTTSASYQIAIPAGGSINLSLPHGIGFTSGMYIAVTGGVPLNDNTGITANDVIGFVTYA